MERVHIKRIKKELKALGVTWYGMQKFCVRYLPTVIHKDEHIKGIVYGRYKEKNGLSLNEGALVATDQRVIFLDHKPGFTNTDDILYTAISGVKLTKAFFSSVTLHSRFGDFTIQFANPRCATDFVEYIEKSQLSTLD